MAASERSTSTLKLSVLDLFQTARVATPSTSQNEDYYKAISHNWKDQTDAVAQHTNKGIDFLERFGSFAKERAAIEDEYAAKLRALAKKNFGKKKEDEEAAKTFTYVRSFATLLKELESLAGQHEVIGERIRKDVLPFVAQKATQHKATRKQHLGDLTAIHQTLNHQIENMFKHHKHYAKSFKEAESSFLKYSKAEKNMEISRLDLEKARTNSQMRNQMSEDAKHQYAAALQLANDAQHMHYEQQLPAVLDRMRQMDEERIRDTQDAMAKTVAIEREVQIIVNRCHDDMQRAIALTNPAHDTAVVVEQFRTGYKPPQPFPFEDLGSAENILHANGDGVDGTIKRSTLPSRPKDPKVARKQSMHHKLFGGGGKDKGSSEGEYGSLPPQQRIRRLQQRIGELQKELDKNVQARDGVAKMQQVYKDNPKLGSASDCEQQLGGYQKEIDLLTREIGKMRVLLDDANSQNNLPIGSHSGADTPPSIRSGDGVIAAQPPRLPVGRCRIAATNGTHYGVNGGASSSAGGTSQRTSYSEDSHSVSSDGRGGSGGGTVGGATNNNERRDEVYEECEMVVLGTCSAQFAYEGGAEGTMNMKEGEEMLLVEKDEGDGWTRVRRAADGAEGFVPTSYLKCKWYPAD